jgi:20S proteasome alpha/beta subunit
MTICMAAICADGAGSPGTAVVVASDRMVTMANLIEFEHTVPKSTSIGARAVALISGDALTGTHLVREVAAELATSPMTVAQVAQALSNRYSETRNRHAEADILVPRGLNWAAFYGQHQNLVAQITLMLDQALSQYNLGVELLVAGVDDAGGHISTLHNPGSRPLDHDVIGYAAVGSGQLHSVQSMIGFRHAGDTSLAEAIFRVYASKRRAEVAPGVGDETDMFVIDAAGTHPLPVETLDELGNLYHDFMTSMQQNLRKRLSTLPLGIVNEEKKGEG